ncbi:MAG: TetR/AcrR family transcriptional regulator [Dehalococcoidia bacterium]
MTKVSDRYLEERRQEILDAARRVFVGKGYPAATVNDIAAEAGVAAGSIYRYFASKADLIAAVACVCIEDEQELWKTSPPDGVTPGEAFLRLGGEVQDEFDIEEHAAVCILRLESYLAASRDAELREVLSRSLDESSASLATMVRRAQESGEFDESLDAEQLARFLHAVGAGIGAMSVAYGPEFDARSLWDVLIRLVGAGFTGGLPPAHPTSSEGSKHA